MTDALIVGGDLKPTYYRVKLSGPGGYSYLRLTVPLHLVKRARRQNMRPWTWGSRYGSHHFESEKEAKYKLRLNVVRGLKTDPDYRIEIVECLRNGSEKVVYPRPKPTVLDRLAAI